MTGLSLITLFLTAYSTYFVCVFVAKDQCPDETVRHSHQMLEINPIQRCNKYKSTEIIKSVMSSVIEHFRLLAHHIKMC